MCKRINGTMFKFVFVHLYFIVFLYLTVMIETVNNTNEDELVPHLYRNMERQARIHKVSINIYHEKLYTFLVS